MRHLSHKGFLGSDDFLSEFHFLGFHVLLDPSFTVSEGLLDNLVNFLLDLVVLLGDNADHLAVEHLQFVVKVIYLILDL